MTPATPGRCCEAHSFVGACGGWVVGDEDVVLHRHRGDYDRVRRCGAELTLDELARLAEPVSEP